MGLLGDYMPQWLPEDPDKQAAMRQGLLQFGAAMLQGRGNFGNAFGGGLAAGAQGYGQAIADQSKQQLQGAQMKQYGLEAQKLEGELGRPKRLADILASQGAVGSGGLPAVSPAGSGASAPQTQSLFNTYTEYARKLTEAGEVGEAQKYMALAEKVQKKIKEQKTLMHEGNPVNVITYDDGSQEVSAYGAMPDNQIVNLGGSNVVIDKNVQSDGKTYQNTQSPDSVASVQQQERNSRRVDARAGAANRLKAEELSSGGKPQFSAEYGGFIGRPTAQNPNGTFTPLPGKPDKPLTEDQGKATGWLVQAENAYKNMQKATSAEINPKTQKPVGTPSAARPGFPDMVAGIPSFGIGGAIANKMRGNDRQKFMQGGSSLSEALLRAATGAGVNKEEAAQKIREITPVFGDSDETIAQKMESIPLYIESLKVRAGSGAKKAAAINAVTKPKFLGFE